MVTYSSLIDGYSVANCIEHKCTSATITPQTNFLDINAGWSTFPVASLPGSATFELALTSAKFQTDLFEMSSGVDFADNESYEVPIRERLIPNAEGKVVLSHVPVATSLSISGLEEVASSATLASGQYKLDASDDEGKTIMFYAGNASASPAVEGDVPAGTEVEIMYAYEAPAREAQFDNMESTMGEAIAEYPCYNSGDNCTTANIVGYLYVRIYRCRATQKPGFDSSLILGKAYSNVCTNYSPKQGNSFYKTILC